MKVNLPKVNQMAARNPTSASSRPQQKSKVRKNGKWTFINLHTSAISNKCDTPKWRLLFGWSWPSEVKWPLLQSPETVYEGPFFHIFDQQYKEVKQNHSNLTKKVQNWLIPFWTSKSSRFSLKPNTVDGWWYPFVWPGLIIWELRVISFFGCAVRFYTYCTYVCRG